MYSFQQLNSAFDLSHGDLPKARLRTVVRALGAAALLLAATVVFAQKPPALIRAHLLENPDQRVAEINSIEPFSGEVLDQLLETRIWRVAFQPEGQAGESLRFMAVTADGEVLRIRSFQEPASREDFVRLLPEDFRITSVDDARQLVAATRELYFGFPFSEPELSVDELRAEQRGAEFFFVDGERFGDATGYRIGVDDAGRVLEYEYSWELPIAP